MSKPYPKIPALYERDSEMPRAVRVGVHRSEFTEYLFDSQWQFTEKVDGTNIRIIWDGYNVSIRGRTDKAQIPPMLADRLDEYLDQAFALVMEQKFGAHPVTFYGEGYGAKIQKGGSEYLPDANAFALFDVLVGYYEGHKPGQWLNREDYVPLAKSLGMQRVPSYPNSTLRAMAEHVRDYGVGSLIKESRAEGLVGIPNARIRDTQGHRIQVKLKQKEL